MRTSQPPARAGSLHKYSLSLVIPCYNESGRLEKLFGPLGEFIPTWNGALEVVIVDDGSNDDTAEQVRNHHLFQQLEKNGQAQLISYQPNKGKGNALREGVLAAKNDHILTLDADMSMKPTELHKWIDRNGGTLSDHEILIASREKEGSTTVGEQSRRPAGLMFNRIVRLVTPLSLSDTQCGFKLYPAAVARQLFADLKVAGWAHDVELLCRAKMLGVRVREMPIHWFHEPGSKINVLRDSFRMMGQLIRISWLMRRAYYSSGERGKLKPHSEN